MDQDQEDQEDRVAQTDRAWVAQAAQVWEDPEEDSADPEWEADLGDHLHHQEEADAAAA